MVEEKDRQKEKMVEGKNVVEGKLPKGKQWKDKWWNKSTLLYNKTFLSSNRKRKMEKILLLMSYLFFLFLVNQNKKELRKLEFVNKALREQLYDKVKFVF